jgi:hypothetical protein
MSEIDFWHVQLPNGSVCTMTLDELDEAFQSDRIHEGTYVLKHGETSWATLSALLGLDGEEPAPSVTPQPVVATPISSYPPPASSAPIYSLRPVVSEIDESELDMSASQFRSSKKRLGIIAGSVAGVAAIAIAVAALGSSESTPPPVAAKQAPVTAPAAPPPPPVAAPAPAPVDTSPGLDRFSDAQKRALADADKTRAAQAAQKAAARASSAPVHHSSYKSDGKPVFHKGGDKHDPLNSSL